MPRKSVDELIKDLKARGWSEEEINKVVEMYNKTSENKRFTMIIVYWLSLLVTIITNFLLTAAIVLFLITLPIILIYILVIFIALGFGTLLLIVLKDIRTLDPEHYVLISIFFPTIAFVNVFIITTVATILKTSLNLVMPDPLIVSLVYVYSFSMPYLINLIKEGVKEEKEIHYWVGKLTNPNDEKNQKIKS
ncbi:MAG: hypothetical protein QXS41_02015 [Candidatus Woesearchaeota archaeon]